MIDPQLQPLIDKATADVENLLKRYGNSINPNYYHIG